MDGSDGRSYEALIRRHGVRIGQVYRHDAGAGAEIEVVYVTPAFAVLHSTKVDVGSVVEDFKGIAGRYASPYVESIEQLLHGLSRARPRYRLVKDSPPPQGSD